MSELSFISQMKPFHRMKKKWGVGIGDLMAILLAFSLTGMTIILIRKPVLALLLPESTPHWVSVVTYIITIVPLYYVFLMLYGSLLGQFTFFWEREKKMGRWVRRKLFSK